MVCFQIFTSAFEEKDLNVANKMLHLFKYDSLSNELVAGVSVKNMTTQVKKHGYS